jgi:hypothetical protein
MLCICTVVLTGCSRGIKEGLYAITGAGGKATLIQGHQDQLSTVASRFGGVRIELFENEVGSVCPDAFLTALPNAVQEQLRYRPRSVGGTLTGAQKQPFFAGPADKLLVIRGRVIQYDVGGTKDKILGPLDEVICRTEFVDSATGETLAVANLTGRAKSSFRTGPQELANGVAKGIADLLKPADD